MSAAKLQSILMVYFFPVQFAIGIIGNIVNLIVLLNKRMRSKINVLLAILALADILFLIFMLLHSLRYHPGLMKNYIEVRRFLVYASPHFAGILNLCSFVSAWIIVLVSVERMTAVLWPLKARLFWNYKTLRNFIIFILIASFLVSLHLHITHEIIIITRNGVTYNKTTGLPTFGEKQVLTSVIRSGWESYWKFFTLLDTFFIVFIPVTIVIFANTSIVYSLHKKRPSSIIIEKEQPHDFQNESHSGRQSSMHNSVRSQRRATFIVVVIASSFTICQIPSAIIHICEIIYPEIGGHSEFRSAATITNSLVVTTKTMNLFLFCMWSANFRKNLARIIIAKVESFLKNARRKKNSKGGQKVETKHNYSEPIMPSTPNKRSLASLMRTPAFLQIRHSLPVNMDCNEVGRTEQDVLLK